jgi:hypothetical protein
LQMPHATVHSSLVAEAWLAWHSMQRSMMWLRQMAQLSTTMSHAQRATAFHCDMLALSRDRFCSARTHLLDFEALLVAVSAGASLGHLRLCRGRIGHIHVGHVCVVCRDGGVCGELRELLMRRLDVTLGRVSGPGAGGAAETKSSRVAALSVKCCGPRGSCEWQGSSSASERNSYAKARSGNPTQPTTQTVGESATVAFAYPTLEYSNLRTFV